ncbi:MAG: cyclopropane-fatty-acyl-phospholipid synthase family protein [Alphaproteobacteria bacterium]
MLLARTLKAWVTHGHLRIVDANGAVFDCGDVSAPPVTIRLHDRRLHHRLLLWPGLAFGEAYMDGTLTIEAGSLADLLQILMANDRPRHEFPFQRYARWLDRMSRRLQQFNPVSRARANVAHHYDLSGKLYDLFLDQDRQYSCAYFTSPEDSLETAQENKKRHIASKLLIRPGQRVLDIGSGWGGLALYLARETASDVTGVTLSTEQYAAANRRSAEAGLDNRVRFFLRDYRQMEGRFDRIVSVGMFEHVGATHYPMFFRKIKSLLADDGVALLHSIGRMEPPGTTNAWLRKYIFPGGYSPALSEVLRAIEQAGLWVTDIEILRLHYADTLKAWYDRFQANRDQIRDLYDERFCRMWEFYLLGCEIAFRHWNQMVFQIQLAKRPDAVPLTRDYLFEWEQAQLGGAKPHANQTKTVEVAA